MLLFHYFWVPWTTKYASARTSHVHAMYAMFAAISYTLRISYTKNQFSSPTKCKLRSCFWFLDVSPSREPEPKLSMIKFWLQFMIGNGINMSRENHFELWKSFFFSIEEKVCHSTIRILADHCIGGKICLTIARHRWFEQRIRIIIITIVQLRPNRASVLAPLCVIRSEHLSVYFLRSTPMSVFVFLFSFNFMHKLFAKLHINKFAHDTHFHCLFNLLNNGLLPFIYYTHTT